MIGRLVSWPALHPARAGALAGWVQQGASLGSAVLLIPLVTAYLLPAEAGIWFVFQALLGMVTMLDLGFGFALSRQVAFTLGGGRGDEQKGDFLQLAPGWDGLAQLFKLSRQLYRLLALGGFFVALAIFEVLANFGHLLPVVTTEVRICWYALTVASVLLILAGGQTAFLNGLGLVYQTRILATAYQVLAAAGAAAAIWWGWGLSGMGLSFAVAAALHYICVGWVRAKFATGLQLHGGTSAPKGALKALAKAALPVGGVNAFGTLIYTVQTPLLGFLLGPEKVAPFYLAQKIGLAFNLAVVHTVSPQMPFFTRSLGQKNLSGALQIMQKILWQTALLQIAASLAFYFLSPAMASILLQRTDYLPSGVLALLALDFCLAGLSVNWAWFVLASGRNPFVIPTVITGILTVALTVMLVPRMGVIGIPISALIANLAANHWFNFLKGLQLLTWLRRAGTTA